ncbi:cell division protein FtsQ [Tistlia consotensis]|uniref:Cell division protein FtsQ n=1 Tax=Tistlia consotensis USBA 355 TaxID=560819 RepID=A0A1Y6CSP4_9PROT|nr:cell division protein FtsQ/DivIB [Tistlia consotensis]SMF71024.1 cell division protein FtsQ [Tistlia consotensis USBA 355]SNS06915.1 cell division protein FtsQ [Tistlia consotensis]
MRLSRAKGASGANPTARPRPPVRGRPNARSGRRPAARRPRRWGRWLGYGLPVVLLLGTGGLIWHSGILDRAASAAGEATLQLTGDLGLKVRDVLVEGRSHTESDQLLGLLGVRRGMPILAFDPGQARERLDQLPWVADAEVERRLPDTLFIRLIEKTPLALWQHDGKITVIDTRGDVIPGVSPGRFSKLLLVVGEDAAPHAAELIEMLNGEPDLAGKVTAAIRVGDRRWNLRLDGNIDVRLPEDGAPAAWSRFAQMVRQEHLLDHDVAVVDLRLPDRLIVRTSRGGVPPLRAKGQET